MQKTFPDSIEENIPKTLNQCTQVDVVSQTLWNWAHRFDLWGKIIFYILIFIGIVSTIIDAVYTFYLLEEVEYYEYILAVPGAKVPVISSIIKWGFYAFLVYIISHMLALHFGALATLTQNSTITANVALFNSGPEPKVSKVDGDSASKHHQEQFTPPVPPAPGFWVCKACGTHNKDTYYQCKTCTQYRS